jgi:hypothetical protein
MPLKNARCPYCSKALPNQNGVRLHVSATLPCNKAWKKQFSQTKAKPSKRLPLKTPDEDYPSSPWSRPNSPTNDEMDTIADNFHLPWSTVAPSESIGEEPPSLSLQANNVEVEDVRGLRFSLPYPRSIANPVGFQKTRFEKQRDHDLMNGKQPWQPFSSQDEWELARWLINNVNQKATDKYLKLPIVS